MTKYRSDASAALQSLMIAADAGADPVFRGNRTPVADACARGTEAFLMLPDAWSIVGQGCEDTNPHTVLRFDHQPAARRSCGIEGIHQLLAQG